MNPLNPPFGFRATPPPAEEAARVEKTTAALAELAKDLPQQLPAPFSGVVAFEVDDGPIVQAAHFPDAALSPEVPMNILSVGKLFTAVAIMQLIQDGQFSLKTPLKSLLTREELNLLLRPPYDVEAEEVLGRALANYESITIEDLLSHTAGLGKTHSPEDPPITAAVLSNYPGGADVKPWLDETLPELLHKSRS